MNEQVEICRTTAGRRGVFYMERQATSTTSRLILLAAAVIILGGIGVFVAGRAAAAPGMVLAQGTPGSDIDPLVSKSYVDQLAQWHLVTVEPGRTLVGSEGTEIVLRAGQIKVIASTNGGLADVTAGKDLAGGEVVKGNHLVIVPRSDGRGIQAVTRAILLVRGSYEIR